MHLLRSTVFLLLALVADGAYKYNDDNYDDDDYYGNADNFNPQIIEPCEGGVVQVVNMTVLCDSPYAYYYGNGAHRNSPYCDYGDKATIKVGFYITDDLKDDITIYALMSAYTEAEEQLFKSTSVGLCSALVGKECNYAGYYEFTKQVSLNDVAGNQSQFVPLIEMSFSNYADGTYTLGGLNIDCDEHNSDYYIDWINGRTNSTLLVYRTQSFASEYGILVGTLTVLGIFMAVLVRQGGDKIEQQGPAKPVWK